MLVQEVHELVAGLRAHGSDDSDVEAKRSETALPQSLRQSLSAFANTAGGTIVLGLDESSGFQAVGARDAPKLSSDLAAMASDDLEPPLRLSIRTHAFEGVDLVVAEVPAVDPPNRPCYVKAAGRYQGSYLRVGDSNRRLTEYEIHLLVSGRGQPRDDEEVLDVPVDAADGDLVDRFVRRLRARRSRAFGDLTVDQVLIRAGVVRDDRLTLAGLLALGEYPQQFLPQLMITFVHYPTPQGPDVRTGERFIDNVVVEGPIPVMVRDALVALRRNMTRRATVRGAGRVDAWEYPEEALREAVTNALVHRDYSPASRGTQVQIEMYPDRLVLTNPGGLHGPVTADGLGESTLTSSRNATLLKVLEDVPMPGTDAAVCENRGTGIRMMLAALRAAAMSPPRFSDAIASFRVTFGNHTLLAPETVSWINSLGQSNLTDAQCLGLAMLRNGEVLDNKAYRSASDLGSRLATAELADLVARGLVAVTGGRQWARYEMGQEVAEESGEERAPATRADRRPEILAGLGGEELSRSEIAARTGLKDDTVRSWLARMREEGSVELTGGAVNSPRARYRRVETLDFGSQREKT
ncbi:MAG: ATP-binding protein [Sporichthyaceae bacterium]